MGEVGPATGGLLETSIYVAELDRAEEFYRRVFGWKRMLRDQRMCALGLPEAGVLLLFAAGGCEQPATTPMGIIPGHGASGRTHLCLKVAAVDIEAWAAHLTRLGIAIESRVGWPRGGISLYFRDPDQHSLEVASPGLWDNY